MANDLGRLAMPRWYLLVVTFAATLLLAVLGVLYTNWSISRQDKAERENDRRWCEMLVTLDDAYGSTPPQSELGRRLAADIHKLRIDLGC